MIEAKAVDLAYLAGVIDSDGYISIHVSKRNGRNYFGAQVGISGSRRESHDLAASIFGGRVYDWKPKGDRAHHKVQYQWVRNGGDAIDVIAAVFPYLRVKADQAQIVFGFWEAQSIHAECVVEAGRAPEHLLFEYVEALRGLHARRGRWVCQEVPA